MQKDIKRLSSKEEQQEQEKCGEMAQTPQVANKHDRCGEEQQHRHQHEQQGECTDHLHSPPGTQQMNRCYHPNFEHGQSSFNPHEQQHCQCDQTQMQPCQQGQPKLNVRQREQGRPHHLDGEKSPAFQRPRRNENTDVNCQHHQDAPPGSGDDHG